VLKLQDGELRRMKIFDEGYNFALEFISIEGLHTNLWASKVSIQFWEFRDSQTQNDIWVLVLWPSIKYTIRGKVVASPKFGLWWILWVRVCSWFICAPKVLELCTNQLIVWFVWVCVNKWIACCFFNPIPKL